MDVDSAPSTRPLPPLVWYCQRVAITHLDSIDSVYGLPYKLVEPVLEACSADHLSRLEQASPNITIDTHEIWRQLCENTYRQFWAEYEVGKHEEPESWKDAYFDLRLQEAKRLEMLAAKLRNKRVEHEERKREREVKLTDRLPPSKKQRTWGQQQQTKTLFEKARSRTAQLQQGIYTRMLPPMPPIKNYPSNKRPSSLTTKPSSSSSSDSSSSSSSTLQSGTRITVNKIAVRKPPMICLPPNTTTLPKPFDKPPIKRQSPAKPPPQAASSPPSGKKDPMGALFMPKHRAHSQLPLSSTHR